MKLLRVKRILLTICLLMGFFQIPVSAASYESSEEGKPVVLQLRWEPQFQFAGYYAALWQGYYEEAGLDVTIRSAFDEKGNIRQATEEVQAGRADFGVGAVDILFANENGKPLTVVAAIFQRSAVAYYRLEETKVNNLVDLMDRKVARRHLDLLDVELQAMLIAEGIDPAQLPYTDKKSSFTLEDLTSRRYDIVPSYLDSILLEAREAEVEVSVLRPLDYGIDFYGDSVFTTVKLAEERPEMVEAFRKATLEGWRYALENPLEMATLITESFEDTRIDQGYASGHAGYDYSMYPSEFLEYNKFQAQQVMELTYYPVVELGNLHPFRWEETHQALSRLGLITKPLDIQSFIFDYESLEQEKQQQRQERLLFLLRLGLLLLAGFLLVAATSRREAHRMEKLFRKEREENSRKEALMIYQARMAAMGEMVAHIAHQWRQPLNNLGLVLANLEDAFTYHELDEEQMNRSVNHSRKLINRMSDTIDDFMQFANPTLQPDDYQVKLAVQEVLDLMEARLRAYGIQVSLEGEESITAYGHRNHFSQAVFNLIANAMDALAEHQPASPSINIRIEQDSPWIMLSISDTGGGIHPSIAEHIFEPYFSTKPEKQGTGLGLYMTKTIVENSLKGQIHWENHQQGVTMIIRMPEKKERTLDDGKENRIHDRT
ncbi:Histidine kinase-, DNA gyrase B-, and HSP90-like ATPase [Tindallia magadiensis]|uniref:histidine kinase n=1 Tax=Tindallia magadiensis TaxID=69895 RepID=A0A1I3DAH0_9FIRM|nr:ABC transporter substrate-binding protein [Tindallia magadiensis]SFH83732.1 Histidine kinase-, DNA gyrase B-, and HSP90-like ATPase [Tindallia magadiensis]